VTLTEDVDVVIATMSGLAPGSYALSAKTTIVGKQGGNDWTRCTLDAGASSDWAETEDKVDRVTMQAAVLATFAGTGTVTYSCLHTGKKDPVARQTKIIAIRIDSVVRTPVTG
jgi:hypothetical protein